MVVFFVSSDCICFLFQNCSMLSKDSFTRFSRLLKFWISNISKLPLCSGMFLVATTDESQCVFNFPNLIKISSQVKLRHSWSPRFWKRLNFFKGTTHHFLSKFLCTFYKWSTGDTLICRFRFLWRLPEDVRSAAFTELCSQVFPAIHAHISDQTSR